MAAKVISFRLTDSTIELINKASINSHLSRTAVVEYSLNIFAKAIEDGTIQKKQLQRLTADGYIYNRVVEAMQTAVLVH